MVHEGKIYVLTEYGTGGTGPFGEFVNAYRIAGISVRECRENLPVSGGTPFENETESCQNPLPFQSSQGIRRCGEASRQEISQTANSTRLMPPPIRAARQRREITGDRKPSMYDA